MTPVDTRGVYSSGQFTTTKNVMVAEASDLGWLAAAPVPMHFDVKSGRTGKVVGFALVETKRGAENDVQLWVYRPVAASVRAVPEAAGVEVHILND